MIYPKFIKENDNIGVPAPSAGAHTIDGSLTLLNGKN